MHFYGMFEKWRKQRQPESLFTGYDRCVLSTTAASWPLLSPGFYSIQNCYLKEITYFELRTRYFLVSS